jgi:hypothetical protein
MSFKLAQKQNFKPSPHIDDEPLEVEQIKKSVKVELSFKQKKQLKQYAQSDKSYPKYYDKANMSLKQRDQLNRY